MDHVLYPKHLLLSVGVGTGSLPKGNLRTFLSQKFYSVETKEILENKSFIKVKFSLVSNR